MKLLTTLSFLIFIFVSDSAVAVRNYFWLVRIMPDLRTFVQGLAGVSIPEGATNAVAEMDFFRLSANSLTSRTGTGPGPRIQSGWNMNNLMALNWQQLRQGKITSSREVKGGLNSFVLTPHKYLLDLSNYLSRTASQIRKAVDRGAVDVVDPSFRFPIPSHIPLSIKVEDLADHSDHLSHSEIEILPPDTIQLLAPMTPVQSPITGIIQCSPLASALNAVSSTVSSESSFNPTIANLLSIFSDEVLCSDGSMDGIMFFVPSLNSYLSVSPSSNSVFSLVPHETFIRLGLIPGADSEDKSHLDPDSWGLGENN